MYCSPIGMRLLHWFVLCIIDDSMEWYYDVTDIPSPVKLEPREMQEDETNSQRSPRVKPLICEECGSDDNAESLLFCRGCDLVYHPYCLIPRLPSAPIGVWYCPSCITKVQCTDRYM